MPLVLLWSVRRYIVKLQSSYTIFLFKYLVNETNKPESENQCDFLIILLSVTYCEKCFTDSDGTIS